MLYKDFVEGDTAGTGDPFEETRAGTILGSDDFVEKAVASLEGIKIGSEVSSYRHLLQAPEPDQEMDSDRRLLGEVGELAEIMSNVKTRH